MNLSLVQVDLGEKALYLVVVGILNHIKISPQKGKKGFGLMHRGSILIRGYTKGFNIDLEVCGS